MSTRNYVEKRGLDRFAVDLSCVRIHQAQYRHVPGWRGAWIWCLKYRDYESAELIRSRNEGDTHVETA